MAPLNLLKLLNLLSFQVLFVTAGFFVNTMNSAPAPRNVADSNIINALIGGIKLFFTNVQHPKWQFLVWLLDK